MQFQPATAVSVEQRAAAASLLRASRPVSRAAVGWCGGWHESSAELRRGLEVIEHDWPAGPEGEALMDLVSFG